MDFYHSKQMNKHAHATRTTVRDGNATKNAQRCKRFIWSSSGGSAVLSDVTITVDSIELNSWSVISVPYDVDCIVVAVAFDDSCWCSDVKAVDSGVVDLDAVDSWVVVDPVASVRRVLDVEAAESDVVGSDVVDSWIVVDPVASVIRVVYVEAVDSSVVGSDVVDSWVVNVDPVVSMMLDAVDVDSYVVGAETVDVLELIVDLDVETYSCVVDISDVIGVCSVISGVVSVVTTVDSGVLNVVDSNVDPIVDCVVVKSDSSVKISIWSKPVFSP